MNNKQSRSKDKREKMIRDDNAYENGAIIINYNKKVCITGFFLMNFLMVMQIKLDPLNLGMAY